MKRNAVLATAALVLLSAPAMGQDKAEKGSFQGEANDAWITGKVEMAYTLNRHLNPFAIDTDVESGVVTLTGNVESDVDSKLAEEIAKGIDGVSEVNNELQVGAVARGDASDSSEDESQERNFPTWFDDATTTAAVKTKLLAESSTKGLEIDVDTHEDVVTLSGSVESDQQKDLAGEIARNTGDVKEVRNQLVVSAAPDRG